MNSNKGRVFPGAGSAGLVSSILLFLMMRSVSAAAPGCVISGRVVDDRGRPVSMLVVNAIGTAPEVEPRGYGAVTNNRGEYCMRAAFAGQRIQAGSYRIIARGEARPLSASPRCAGCCAQAVALVSTAAPSPIMIHPGRVVANIDIRLRRAPVYCVRGEVRNQAGRLMTDIAMGLEFDGGGTAVMLEAGKFLLVNLEPGDYTAVITEPYPFGRALARKPFTVRNRNIRGMVIRADR